jgi:O-succinylbenzoate synthase
MAGRALRLSWRPFAFALPRAMVTSRGALLERRGWLLRLEDAEGRVGWGEAQHLPRAALALLGCLQPRGSLERQLPLLPPPLAFALGMALAELDGLGSGASGGWRPAPPSAVLLPAGEAVLPALEQAMAAVAGDSLCVKWKVAAAADQLERRLLRQLLERLPSSARLRLDANGGWDRATADGWAAALAEEQRLDWLEQPLAPADAEGLRALAARLPVALDESLRDCPELDVAGWPGWQVRRPAAEADPRPLLQALLAGTPRLMISTALETGIGRRLVEHLAALQALGPTPAAPGLAPGWRPAGELFSRDPQAAWAAAGPEWPA